MGAAPLIVQALQIVLVRLEVINEEVRVALVRLAVILAVVQAMLVQALVTHTEAHHALKLEQVKLEHLIVQVPHQVVVMVNVAHIVVAAVQARQHQDVHTVTLRAHLHIVVHTAAVQTVAHHNVAHTAEAVVDSVQVVHRLEAAEISDKTAVVVESVSNLPSTHLNSLTRILQKFQNQYLLQSTHSLILVFMPILLRF